MKINKLSFRNMFCFGNEMQEIYFNEEANLHQIIGKNGVGKSSMIRILKIVLFQEYDGVVVAQIANQINKQGYVEVSVDSNKHNWKIVSEFSPNKLKVYKDGNDEPEDWGGISDSKKRIREEIIDMPYYIFNNAISLSLDDFKSFLSMKPIDSRNIRDRIFGFYVVNEMNEIMKPEISKYVAEVDKFNAKIENINQSIETSQAEYNELKENIKESSQGEINKLNGEIEKLKKELEEQVKLKGKFDEEAKEVKEYVDFIQNETRKVNLAGLKNTLDRLTGENDTAETEKGKRKEKQVKLGEEKQLITGKVTLQKIDDLIQKISEYESKSKGLEPEKDNIEVRVRELEKTIKNFEASADLIKDRNILKVNAEQIITLDKQHKEILDSIKKGSNYLDEIGVKIKEGENKQLERNAIIIDLKKRITAHENGVCSECGTDLTGDDHQKQFEQYKADLELESEKFEKINEMLLKAGSAVDTAAGKVDELKKTEHSMYSKYSDVKISISAVKDFDDAKYILLNSIHNVIEDANLYVKWDAKKLEKAIKSVKIPNSDYDIEADKNKLNEEQILLSEKEGEIDDIIENKRNDITKKDTLQENLQEGVTKENLKATKFSLKSEEEYSIKLKSLGEEIEGYGDTIRNNEREIGESQAKVKQMEEELRPDSDFEHLEDIDTLKGDTIDDKIGMLNKETESIIDHLGKVDADRKIIDQNISNKEITIKSFSSDEHVESQLKSVKTIIDKFEEELGKFNADIEKSQKHVDFFRMVQYILSDEGIKSYILKNIVPSINKEIAKILDMLGVPITVLFDEEFDVHLYRFGEEVSLNTISTGQKKMIDCSILLAITTILRMKYEFNITFYDEIFSSIDSDNRITLLEIFKNICCKKLKLHTFVMNHSYMPSSYFGNIIRIAHKNNFSSMQVMAQDEYESQYLILDVKDAKDLANAVIKDYEKA